MVMVATLKNSFKGFHLHGKGDHFKEVISRDLVMLAILDAGY